MDEEFVEKMENKKIAGVIFIYIGLILLFATTQIYPLHSVTYLLVTAGICFVFSGSLLVASGERRVWQKELDKQRGEKPI
ncbi:hypothetical protein AKJ45_03195 [candidate division MSBL1 archaeon SCGC-AAA261F19]|uniref:Uncharacterized protein n=1 Tax=candidate division MSBL1 archaeon SCGC-AAA261F19 TaxID=1698275 RepID=A0A133V8W0_9EURY|nr:hypothetical protein AKJ45_03195 [candidate division MSBL1 archaeon SCGC-AAA261F19]